MSIKVEFMKIDNFQLKEIAFQKKDSYVLCELQQGTANLIRKNTQIVTSDNLFLLDLKDNNVISSIDNNLLSIRTIEFSYSGLSINPILNCVINITDSQKKILNAIELEKQKNDLIRHSKPSISFDKEIAAYYMICEENRYNLLKQLLLILLEKEIFKTLPNDYKKYISQLSKNEKISTTKNTYSKRAHISYSNEFVNDIINFLNDNLSENLTIDYISQTFFTSSANLKQQFKKTTNKSIMGYFKELKMHKAEQWIRENELSYTEISERLGFNSIHHFSAAFKKYSGYSPSNYYKSLQPGYVNKVNTTEILANHPRMFS